ncbi:hypothetical protein [Streptomyces chilikensis]|uniref:Uncharacterized protein n=1 Tax=Streptomyces chilikensis TaxID=1194079 RepID=A0ABV3EJH3_9ACTN
MPTSGHAFPGARICSLKADVPQLIQPGTTYQTLRFPFGAAESTDPHEMHQAVQPDGYVVANWATDDRSGLIWPSVRGWGHLYAMIQWADTSDATEHRDQFVRDPLALAGPSDTTATEHRATTVGGEFYVKTWGVVTNPGVPLAVRVAHNATSALNVTLAEFKLVIAPLV